MDISVAGGTVFDHWVGLATKSSLLNLGKSSKT